MKRVLAIVFLVSMIVAVPGGVAAADPKTEPLWITCDGVPSGWITSPNGNGPWTPGIASEGTGVYIPYAFDFSLWFLPTGETEEIPLESESFSKRAPKNRHPHGVCTFSETFPVVDDPDLGSGTVRFAGVAWVFYTG